MFENRSTKFVAAALRGISLLCIVVFTLLLFFSLKTGINARSEIQIPLSSNPALFLSDSAHIFLILLDAYLYLSVIFPLAIKNLIATSSLILVILPTGYLGELLWKVSPIAEKFREAKEKIQIILKKWKKEKTTKFTMGILSIIVLYILLELIIQALVLPPNLNYYLLGFSQTPTSQWIAVLSLILFITLLPISAWIWLSIISSTHHPT